MNFLLDGIRPVGLKYGREIASWNFPGRCFDLPPNGGAISQSRSRQRPRTFNARNAVYAKVFTQIFDSSIADNWKTRHVFEDLLKLADINGVVDMTHEAIAARTRMPLEMVQEAIRQLESPDPRSRTPEADGRRIERLDEHRDWGWLIVNYQKFREISSEEQRREKTRKRVTAFRLKHKELELVKHPVTQCNAPETPCNAVSHMERETERQMEKEVLSGKPDVACSSEAPKAPKEKSYHKDARSVLHVLNEACGRGFRETDTNLTLISRRLQEPGVTFEGVSMMIARQCRRWANTTMAEYLRPTTLFGKEKFDAYYAAREQPVILTDDPKAAAERAAKLKFYRNHL